MPQEIKIENNKREEIFITITIEEYKELLITKGKYEELKDKCWKCYQHGTTITYRDSEGGLRYPYAVTCGSTTSHSNSTTKNKKGE